MKHETWQETLQARRRRKAKRESITDALLAVTFSALLFFYLWLITG
jgi:hypothetical protein